MNMGYRHARLAFLLIVAVTGYAYGEQIRGTLAADSRLDFSVDRAIEFNLSLEELGAVRLDEGFDTLIDGIEIEVRIPREAEQYMDGFACIVYASVQPEISEAVRFYRGTQVGYSSLPSRGRLYIRLPLKKSSDTRPAPGTVLFDPLEDSSAFPLVITLLPYMKGIPDQVYDLSFPIKVFPMLKNLGLVELAITDDDGAIPENLRMFIDDDAVSTAGQAFTLTPGLHTLRAEAPGHKPVEQTISVEKGSLSKISLIMEKDTPVVFFEAPRGSKIFLDGEQVQPPFNDTYELSEGEHTVLYTIGDYTISRKFFAEAGGSYKIELFLDILIENY